MAGEIEGGESLRNAEMPAGVADVEETLQLDSNDATGRSNGRDLGGDPSRQSSLKDTEEGGGAGEGEARSVLHRREGGDDGDVDADQDAALALQVADEQNKEGEGGEVSEKVGGAGQGMAWQG